MYFHMHLNIHTGNAVEHTSCSHTIVKTEAIIV